MVVLLLLLMSGDIETNPGPVGEYLNVYGNLHVCVYLGMLACLDQPLTINFK